MCNGMKIGAGAGVLPFPCVAHPVDIAAARILRPYDRLAAMSRAESRDLDSEELAIRQVRHVDIEHHGSSQGGDRETLDQARRDTGRACEVTRAPRLDAQRYRNCRQSKKAPLDGGRHRA